MSNPVGEGKTLTLFGALRLASLDISPQKSKCRANCLENPPLYSLSCPCKVSIEKFLDPQNISLILNIQYAVEDLQDNLTYLLIKSFLGSHTHSHRNTPIPILIHIFTIKKVRIRTRRLRKTPTLYPHSHAKVYIRINIRKGRLKG